MILWSVVDSQLASSEPFREPVPAPGPACGRAKVVIGYLKRLLPNACTTPAQALIDIAGLPPAHTLGRRNGMHIPSRGSPGRGCGQSLDQRYNAQHHTRQGGGATIGRCAASVMPADYALVTPWIPGSWWALRSAISVGPHFWDRLYGSRGSGDHYGAVRVPDDSESE